MGGWTSDELDRIAAADELQLTAAGRTVTIWVVRAGDDLYVRSWRGPGAGWFRRVQQAQEGQVSAGGLDKDVRFVEAGDEVDDEVDDAYRTKYRRYADSYVEPMVRPPARDTTLRLVPR
jgi:hypothetical protein